MKKKIIKTKRASAMPSTLTRRVEGMFPVEECAQWRLNRRVAAMLEKIRFQTLG